MAADPISIVREDGMDWVAVNGERVVGYASVTRAEAFRAGFEAQQRGAKRHEGDRYEPPDIRPGVHRRRMRDAWRSGWDCAAVSADKDGTP